MAIPEQIPLNFQRKTEEKRTPLEKLMQKVKNGETLSPEEQAVADEILEEEKEGGWYRKSERRE